LKDFDDDEEDKDKEDKDDKEDEEDVLSELSDEEREALLENMATVHTTLNKVSGYFIQTIVPLLIFIPLLGLKTLFCGHLPNYNCPSCMV
jgi:hypothetical protein